MNKKIVIAIVLAVVAVVFVGFFVFGKEATAPETKNDSSQSSEQATTEPNSESESNTSAITSAEVAEHSSQDDCWTIIDGAVYDLTDFINQHPGGAAATSQACGIDATGLFNGSQTGGRSGGHSAFDRDQLNSLKIGDLQ